MNDELKSKLLEILTAAQKAGGDAYDYVKREAPELAREMVLWNVVDCAVALVFGLLALVAAGWIWRQLKSNWEQWESRYDGRSIGYPLLLAGALIIGVIVTYCNTIALLQAHYAPRVFFFMSCKELLK